MADTYFQTTLELSNYAEYIQPIITDALEIATELQENTIIITCETPLDLKEISTIINNFSQEFEEKIAFHLHQEERENRDWIEEYKKGVKPVEAGEFYIRPSWHSPKEGIENIVVDPSLVFGTGEHPTTYLCLIAISKHLTKNTTFLDVGSGSGILSLAGAKKEAVVDFCDSDEEAVKATTENFALNQLSFQNAWVGSVNARKKAYDFVIANIVSDILIFLNRDLIHSLNSGGILVLSGILGTYREKVLNSFSDLVLVDTLTKEDWTTLILKKEEDGQTE